MAQAKNLPVLGAIAAIAAFSIVLIVALWFVSEDAAEWERFKAARNCKAVAHVKGSVFNTFGFDSKGGVQIGVGTTPDKTGWQCDDGLTYYR